MSNIYSLNDLKRDMDKEFAPLSLEVDGETLVLRNLLRINDAERNAVLDALTTVEQSSGKEESELESSEIAALSAAITEVLRNVVAEGKGEKLVASLDGDLMLAMRILDMWTAATQPGEAENSPA